LECAQIKLRNGEDYLRYQGKQETEDWVVSDLILKPDLWTTSTDQLWIPTRWWKDEVKRSIASCFWSFTWTDG